MKEAVRKAVVRGRIYEGNAFCDRFLTSQAVLQGLQVGVMRGVARQLLRMLPIDDEAC